jgi:hypothetical protein
MVKERKESEELSSSGESEHEKPTEKAKAPAV